MDYRNDETLKHYPSHCTDVALSNGIDEGIEMCIDIFQYKGKLIKNDTYFMPSVTFFKIFKELADRSEPLF